MFSNTKTVSTSVMDKEKKDGKKHRCPRGYIIMTCLYRSSGWLLEFVIPTTSPNHSAKNKIDISGGGIGVIWV